MRYFLPLALTWLLAACSSPGTLAYMPASAPAVSPAVRDSVSAVVVQDSRDEKPNRLATIRGGYGNPLKVLDTPAPVSDVVAAVWTGALARRQMLAPTGPFRFQVVVKTLYGDQFVGRKAELQMDLVVFDRTGRAIYNDTAKDGSYNFTFFDNGIFAGIDDLRKDVETLLSKNIDAMLDKRQLQDILARPRSVGAPAT